MRVVCEKSENSKQDGTGNLLTLDLLLNKLVREPVRLNIIILR